MNNNITELRERLRQLEREAQPFKDQLEAHPLHDKSFTENLSGRLYLKNMTDFDEEGQLFFIGDFLTQEEARIFVECSRLWLDINQAFTQAVINKLEAEKRARERSSYFESIEGTSAQQIDELLTEAEETEEATRMLTAELDRIRTTLTLLGWTRYIDSLEGDQKRIMSEIRTIAKGIERPNVRELSETEIIYEIIIDHKYFGAQRPIVLPKETASRPINRELITNTLRPLYFYHLRALEYYELPMKRAESIIETSFARLWGVTEAQHYNTSSLGTFYRTKDKVSNQLTLLEPDIERTLSAENQRDKKKGKQIDVYATLHLSGIEEALEGSSAGIAINRLEPEDRQVLDAIVTVWENGERTTTIQTLYQIITKNPRSRITPEKEEELLNRLRKLSLSYIKINAQAESAYYGGKLKDQIEGTIISISIDTSYVNGALTFNTVHILDLDRSPVYRYAKIKKQIASIPLKYLDTKSANKNRETTRIEDYLIDRIESIENTGSTILMRAIFDSAGIYKEDFKDFKDKRKRTIKKIISILDGYVSTGYISSYKVNSKGRDQNYSVTIKK